MKTGRITTATAIEVAVIALALLLAVSATDLVGVTAAALAAMSGRICAVTYLQLKFRQEKHALALDPSA